MGYTFLSENVSKHVQNRNYQHIFCLSAIFCISFILTAIDLRFCNCRKFFTCYSVAVFQEKSGGNSAKLVKYFKAAKFLLLICCFIRQMFPRKMRLRQKHGFVIELNIYLTFGELI